MFTVRSLTTSITGNRIIVANGKNSLTLTCTTGEANPVSNIRWLVNNVGTNSTRQEADQNGDYGGLIRTRSLTLIPTRHNDGDTVTCHASNELNASSPVSSTVVLDLQCKVACYVITLTLLFPALKILKDKIHILNNHCSLLTIEVH